MSKATMTTSTAKIIRNEAAGPVTRGYARSLSQYKPAASIPQYMQDLLRQLEAAEAKKA